MAITVDAANAKIVLKDGNKLRPAAFILNVGANTSQAYIVNTHLTNGFIPGSTRATINAADAFSATATVPLTVPTADMATLKDWNFGFIQFQKISSLTLYYAGSHTDKGELLMEVNRSPAMTHTEGRDHSGDPNPPWLRVGTSGDAVFNPATKLVTVQMGDHPMCVVGGKWKNTKTTYDNYLRKLCDARTFTTIFSARDPQGHYHHLAHFQWQATWDFDFRWLGGGDGLQGMPSAQNRFSMGAVTMGGPKAKSLLPFLADPKAAPKLGTNQQNAALLAAVQGPPTLIENSTYFGSVPDNFWEA